MEAHCFEVAPKTFMLLLDLTFVTFTTTLQVDCGAIFSYILLYALRVVLPD